MLMGVCGILSVAIQIAGPLWLGDLAHFAQRLAQRVAKLQESFQAGVLANTGEAGSA
jgi:tRNA G26 N,N-dimethylase Trm1